MVNSMGSAPIMNYGFKNLVTHNEAGAVSSVHTVPTEQFSHNLDSQGECLCGPDVDFDTASGMVIPHVMHFALDTGFYMHDPEELYS
ncbi:hypothetical protein LCGC14_3022650 [marine sediment metagenome]|uniref:Uncharacterized protein n=1 Tax=marine sediment metagenome TaxID=412755 RepID=A0A0F8XHV5_9ZZZZ